MCYPTFRIRVRAGRGLGILDLKLYRLFRRPIRRDIPTRFQYQFTLKRVSDPKKTEFEQAAAEQSEAGFFREIWGFMAENKKWWLLPLITIFLIFALLIFLSGTGLAPFIYTLF